MTSCSRVLVALLTVLFFSGVATAQEAAFPERDYHFFFIANGTLGVPAGGHRLTSSVRVPDNSPLVTSYTAVSFNYRVPSFMGGDIGGGVLVTPFLGFGVALSHGWSEHSASVSLRMASPDGLILNQGEPTPLKRSETAVHLQFVVKPKKSENGQLLLYGGPTRFSVNQAVISRIYLLNGVDYFDTSEDKATAWGFNVGADMAAFVHPNAGVGLTLRYSRANVPMVDSAKALIGVAGTQSVTAGGFLVGVGLRFRF